MKKVLVAYSTKDGSTAEVAEAIGKALGERGLEAEVRPVGQVAGLEGYGAVVLGSPINGMRWQQPAESFVGAHAAALRGMPVALFYLSYIEFAEGRPTWRRSIRKGMEALSAAAGAFSCRGFGGKLASPLPPAARFLFGTRKDAPADLRDWDAVRSWAGEIAPRLGA